MPNPYPDQPPARPIYVRALATQLRPISPDFLVSHQMAWVGSIPLYRWYTYSAISILPDDGLNVIKPNAIPALSPGRWLLVPNPSTVAEYIPPFKLSGVYSAAIVPGFFDPPFYVPAAMTITSVRLFRRTPGTAGQTTVELHKNGVNILAAPLTLLAAAGPYSSVSTAVFNPVGANILAPGDRLEAVLTAVDTFALGPPQGPEGLSLSCDL